MPCLLSRSPNPRDHFRSPTDDGADVEQVVAGSEAELAATGGNVVPAGLGLLLVLAGGALIATRRVALK
jgi:hypothetical protein